MDGHMVHVLCKGTFVRTSVVELIMFAQKSSSA